MGKYSIRAVPYTNEWEVIDTEHNDAKLGPPMVRSQAEKWAERLNEEHQQDKALADIRNYDHT